MVLFVSAYGGAEKKTDVEKHGFKGRVKSVEPSASTIEEEDGKPVRTRGGSGHTKYDEKGNKVKKTLFFRAETANGETRFVPNREQTWKSTYRD